MVRAFAGGAALLAAPRGIRPLPLLAGGIALAATIWLPSVVEARDTHAERLTTGALQYSSHYVAPAQFFSTAWGYGVSIPGDQDGMSFALGWALLIAAAIGGMAVARFESDEWKQWFAFFAGATVVLCFLMTQRAHAIWDAIPQLHYIAFPWRLLAPATFCLALLAASVVLAVPRLGERWRTAAYAAVIAAIVLSGLPHAKPVSYLSLDETLWTPRSIAMYNVVAATFDTFESRWVQVRPTYADDHIVAIRGSATATVTQRRPDRLVAEVRAAETSDLELPLAYFPGWRVRIDGAEQPLDTPSPMGRIRFLIAPGTHRVEASFERTPIRWVADLASLAALLGFALSFGVQWRQPPL